MPSARVYSDNLCDIYQHLRTKGAAMQGETKERWRELCELAVKEQDPAKLLSLIQEINDLLDEKQKRLGITARATDQ